MNFDQSLSTEHEMDSPPLPNEPIWRVAFFVVAIAVAFTAGSLLTRNTMPVMNSQNLVTPSASFEKPVFVQIGGRVKQPGVYQLPFDSRIFEAISKAGGLLPDAETETINLADWVKDGSQIIVPSKQQAPTLPTVPAITDSAPEAFLPHVASTIAEPPITGKPFTTELKPASPKSASPKSATKNAAKKSSKELPQQPIDLNRAASEELQKLPGVGPAMAERILQYRKESQGFTAVDDLDNVRGIGAKTLEKLRPFVVVKPLPFQKANP